MMFWNAAPMTGPTYTNRKAEDSGSVTAPIYCRLPTDVVTDCEKYGT